MTCLSVTLRLQLLEEKQAVKLDSLGRKRVELDHVLGEVEHAFTVADRAMAVLQVWRRPRQS